MLARVADRRAATAEDDGHLGGTAVAGHRFPRADWVGVAAALLDQPPSWTDPRPGGVVARYRLRVGPGVVRVGAFVTGGETDRADGKVRGRVVEWSRPSRLRMVETMCGLEWGPVVAPGKGWRPAMVTLTLPGEWRRLAPTGQHFKRLVQALWLRWERKWGRKWAGIWKLEFQRRGAPHLHAYCAVQVGRDFREWLSRAWYEVVGSGDERHLNAGTRIDVGEGIRASDPRRLAGYFAKRAVGHNVGRSKEYQHYVPVEWGGIDRATGEVGPQVWWQAGGGMRPTATATGPGRFWGYRGLERATVEVELDEVQFLAWRRLLRRWSASKGRPVRSLRVGRRQGGMVLTSDGPGLVAQAARWDGLAGGDPIPGAASLGAHVEPPPVEVAPSVAGGGSVMPGLVGGVEGGVERLAGVGYPRSESEGFDEASGSGDGCGAIMVDEGVD